MSIVNFITKCGTAAEWAASDPVLLKGQQGFETDTGRSKYGDGSTVWNSLVYQTQVSPFYPHKSNIAALPSPNGAQPAFVFISDTSKPAYSDGLNWRYFDDNSIIV
jgi:hypothetical protein|tara:strand:- start:2176 stop:2493 length:318 start_codon:yes stop_codon:yes gene_type:complete